MIKSKAGFITKLEAILDVKFGIFRIITINISFPGPRVAVLSSSLILLPLNYPSSPPISDTKKWAVSSDRYLSLYLAQYVRLSQVQKCRLEIRPWVQASPLHQRLATAPSPNWKKKICLGGFWSHQFDEKTRLSQLSGVWSYGRPSCKSTINFIGALNTSNPESIPSDRLPEHDKTDLKTDITVPCGMEWTAGWKGGGQPQHYMLGPHHLGQIKNVRYWDSPLFWRIRNPIIALLIISIYVILIFTVILKIIRWYSYH